MKKSILKESQSALLVKSAELDLIAKELAILKASENENTQRALANAVKHFTVVFGETLPCTDMTLKKYLVTYAGVLSVSTLEQRRVLIGRWHKEKGFSHNPNDSELIRKYMRGIRRNYNKAPKQAKPIQLDIIDKVIKNLQKIISDSSKENHKNRLKAVRDKALLLTAFWFGLRSDELINLRVCDVDFSWDAEPPSFEIYLQKSKTDKEGRGRKILLESLPNLCPMHALRDWIELTFNGVESKNAYECEDPLFSKISRWGVISKNSIHHNSINKLFRDLLDQASVNGKDYSSHSMRRGIANWIIDSGASIADLKDWIGWKDTRSAARYIEGKSSLPSKIIKSRMNDKMLSEVSKGRLENNGK